MISIARSLSLYIYLCLSLSLYIYIYMHTYMYVCVYIYIYTHVHVYTHTCILYVSILTSLLLLLLSLVLVLLLYYHKPPRRKLIRELESRTHPNTNTNNMLYDDTTQSHIITWHNLNHYNLTYIKRASIHTSYLIYVHEHLICIHTSYIQPE